MRHLKTAVYGLKHLSGFNWLQIILIWSCLWLLSACDFSDTTNVTIALYGQGGNFSGEYTLDDDSVSTGFSGDESSSDIFKYHKDITIENKVTVDVYPQTDDGADDPDLTDLTFRVFSEDGNIVYESSYAISSSLMKTFIYRVSDTQTTI